MKSYHFFLVFLKTCPGRDTSFCLSRVELHGRYFFCHATFIHLLFSFGDCRKVMCASFHCLLSQTADILPNVNTTILLSSFI